MKFKYGTATVTARNTKDGAVVTNISFDIGGDKMTLNELNYGRKVEGLLSKLEVKANEIFSKNSKTKTGGNRG